MVPPAPSLPPAREARTPHRPPALALSTLPLTEQVAGVHVSNTIGTLPPLVAVALSVKVPPTAIPVSGTAGAGGVKPSAWPAKMPTGTWLSVVELLPSWP